MWTQADQQRASEIANLVAVASLLTALIALLLAHQAWKRPYPADPTQIPSWGSPANPHVIGSPVQGQEFFDFLQKNAGRKVRLAIDLDPSYFGNPEDRPYDPDETGFYVPSPDCMLDPPTGVVEFSPSEDCPFLWLFIRQVGGDRRGLYWQEGGWHLSGYFASLGFQRTSFHASNYAITPLTDVEAVS
jgi:hypothetical protein